MVGSGVLLPIDYFLFPLIFHVHVIADSHRHAASHLTNCMQLCSAPNRIPLCSTDSTSAKLL